MFYMHLLSIFTACTDMEDSNSQLSASSRSTFDQLSFKQSHPLQYLYLGRIFHLSRRSRICYQIRLSSHQQVLTATGGQAFWLLFLKISGLPQITLLSTRRPMYLSHAQFANSTVSPSTAFTDPRLQPPTPQQMMSRPEPIHNQTGSVDNNALSPDQKQDLTGCGAA
jgi:hypothetical protein